MEVLVGWALKCEACWDLSLVGSSPGYQPGLEILDVAPHTLVNKQAFWESSALVPFPKGVCQEQPEYSSREPASDSDYA